MNKPRQIGVKLHLHMRSEQADDGVTHWFTSGDW